MTNEHLEGALAQYYGLSYLSFRSASHPMMTLQLDKRFRWNETVNPANNHYGVSGHKMIADMAVYLVQETYIDMLLNAIEALDVCISSIPPMYPGNLPPNATMCITGIAFQNVVKRSIGWDFINEGTAEKQKYGYVSWTPGNELVVVVDSLRPLLPITTKIPVLLHYLKSYQHMGMAIIRY
ncbi:hypothetical protein TSOC_013556 [Tetrabaena socialis]|uniref:Uncharacterized protein n=1 Tax=Tetrabaena socialis TaxID=47790 RepID=A0A2J7ZK13_9CHLO|nr:hypothetical protein TSOC_013556 [Tetrabaena socialis]|eukprot:PNH00616.1 hypothetical protein TSOC_013556 [Tetrabaena socialis]